MNGQKIIATNILYSLCFIFGGMVVKGGGGGAEGGGEGLQPVKIISLILSRVNR